ncbi:putative electron transfer flavoprotein-ubiquinone oxidoreductase [Plasmopara halstedii]
MKEREVQLYSNDFAWEDLARTCEMQVEVWMDDEALGVKANNKLLEMQQLAIEAKNKWDDFHQRNKGKAYKPRNYLIKEFPELDSPDREVIEVLELGCGYGSTIFPILAKCPNVHAQVCDFSANAIDILQLNADYDSKRCRAFVCDIALEELKDVAPESIDIVLMIFVLSALPPESFARTLKKIYAALQPEGVVCFRDYGLYDLAMRRNAKKLGPSLYYRNDGTLAYFFSREKLSELFSQAGFIVLENDYCTVRLRNRKNGVTMDRVWLHAKFRKPVTPRSRSHCKLSLRLRCIMWRRSLSLRTRLVTLKYQPIATRFVSSAVQMSEEQEMLNGPREAMDYDVLMVGAGPASLAAAIRLKQLSAERGTDLSVCVVEKGAEVGSHIVSGNVLEPRALNELLPNWKELGAPLDTPVSKDKFLLLTEQNSFSLPHFILPREEHNDGNYVISLSKFVRWMGEQAEEAGVEIYPGFSASEVLYRDDGSVSGIATRDVGIGKDGKPKNTFARGMELRARVTLFGEGCRGSCSEEVMEKFNLREGVQPQTYGIGVKEVWRIPKENHQAGLVQHTLGWPLQRSVMDKTFGGSFMYHMEDDLVQIGLVVGLDYENPYINPYEELQQFKTHPAIRKFLEGGECIQYGARCLNEGGYHAIPKLTFPGGALIGCSAGFLNGVKIKGTHTAMKSGMLAAEAAYEALTINGATPVAESAAINSSEEAVDISSYEAAVEKSWVAEELKAVRNVHAGFHKGFLPGLLYAGVATHVLRGKEPWTIANTETDANKTRPANNFTPIQYPKPDGQLTFDLLSNLQRSGTNHNHDQPSHLRIKSELSEVPSKESYPVYAGPEQRFCPARVYEYTDGTEANGVPQLVINAQNCVHCKCCSIKMPKEYIKWTVPEGGGGPAYELM